MSRATPPADPKVPSTAPDQEPTSAATATAPADTPEPADDDSPSNKCAKCGAEFSGEGARKAYRDHMEAFHPKD